MFINKSCKGCIKNYKQGPYLKHFIFFVTYDPDFRLECYM
jgi:hypothetical protein